MPPYQSMIHSNQNGMNQSQQSNNQQYNVQYDQSNNNYAMAMQNLANGQQSTNRISSSTPMDTINPSINALGMNEPNDIQHDWADPLFMDFDDPLLDPSINQMNNQTNDPFLLPLIGSQMDNQAISQRNRYHNDHHFDDLTQSINRRSPPRPISQSTNHTSNQQFNQHLGQTVSQSAARDHHDQFDQSINQFGYDPAYSVEPLQPQYQQSFSGSTNSSPQPHDMAFNRPVTQSTNQPMNQSNYSMIPRRPPVQYVDDDSLADSFDNQSSSTPSPSSISMQQPQIYGQYSHMNINQMSSLSINNPSINNQSMNQQMLNNQLQNSQNQAMNNQPMHNQSMHNQSINNQSMHNQTMNNQPLDNPSINMNNTSAGYSYNSPMDQSINQSMSHPMSHPVHPSVVPLHASHNQLINQSQPNSATRKRIRSRSEGYGATDQPDYHPNDPTNFSHAVPAISLSHQSQQSSNQQVMNQHPASQHGVHFADPGFTSPRSAGFPRSQSQHIPNLRVDPNFGQTINMSSFPPPSPSSALNIPFSGLRVVHEQEPDLEMDTPTRHHMMNQSNNQYGLHNTQPIPAGAPLPPRPQPATSQSMNQPMDSAAYARMRSMRTSSAPSSAIVGDPNYGGHLNTPPSPHQSNFQSGSYPNQPMGQPLRRRVVVKARSSSTSGNAPRLASVQTYSNPSTPRQGHGMPPPHQSSSQSTTQYSHSYVDPSHVPQSMSHARRRHSNSSSSPLRRSINQPFAQPEASFLLDSNNQSTNQPINQSTNPSMNDFHSRSTMIIGSASPRSHSVTSSPLTSPSNFHPGMVNRSNSHTSNQSHDPRHKAFNFSQTHGNMQQPMNQSNNQSINPSVNQPVNQSVNQWEDPTGRSLDNAFRFDGTVKMEHETPTPVKQEINNHSFSYANSPDMQQPVYQQTIDQSSYQHMDQSKNPPVTQSMNQTANQPMHQQPNHQMLHRQHSGNQMFNQQMNTAMPETNQSALSISAGYYRPPDQSINQSNQAQHPMMDTQSLNYAPVSSPISSTASFMSSPSSKSMSTPPPTSPPVMYFSTNIQSVNQFSPKSATIATLAKAEPAMSNQTISFATADESSDQPGPLTLPNSVQAAINQSIAQSKKSRAKRRKSTDLPETERWNCPLQCGKYFRRTSSRSIAEHMKGCPKLSQFRSTTSQTLHPDAQYQMVQAVTAINQSMNQSINQLNAPLVRAISIEHPLSLPTPAVTIKQELNTVKQEPRGY